MRHTVARLSSSAAERFTLALLWLALLPVAVMVRIGDAAHRLTGAR